MKKTVWGIIGPGSIAHNFADGLKEAPSGELVALASHTAAKRADFGDEYEIAAEKRYDSYPALCADPEIDAIYISTPHPFHANLAIMAMRAGKAVLVEKPAGLCAAEVTTLTEIAAQEGVFFMEAFMYRCHPQIARMLEIIRSGEIGDLEHIRSHFGFNAGFDPKSRLYDASLAGGAILDVGGYPASLARLVAGAAISKEFDNPTTLRGTGIIGKTGVDQVSYAHLLFASGFTADIAVAISRNMDNEAIIYGSKGEIRLADPWVPGRNAGPSDTEITVTVADDKRVELLKHKEHLFAFEAELASRAIADGLREAPYPAPSHADSIGNNTLLDGWRKELGYAVIGEASATIRRLSGVLPKGLPPMPQLQMDGLDAPLSQLIMGCDNRETLADGAIIWDAWIEAGGNGFDTGFVYGGGKSEKVLGEWISGRGVAKDITVIVKGAHTPYCTPRAIEAQLDISLERLGIAHAPIYIMHRDNPDVPVGEFVDALNALKQAGKIGVFGGSNWTIERFEDARQYAAAHGLVAPQILNNNLSLAVMANPIWDGCLSSNSAETLNYLGANKIAHLSWSAQARGYFLPENIRGSLPADIGPERCFGSKDNEERRRRAGQLAEQTGLSVHNIAAAWVLSQNFASYALIGPRSPGELASSLPALTLRLTEGQVAWLNLQAASPD
ncbi:MAG: aldo/keto reductase [Rhodobacteraceae bacterium]|nr:aldo/keto reductase [Paracoccaceae bacterium]